MLARVADLASRVEFRRPDGEPVSVRVAECSLLRLFAEMFESAAGLSGSESNSTDRIFLRNVAKALREAQAINAGLARRKGGKK